MRVHPLAVLVATGAAALGLLPAPGVAGVTGGGSREISGVVVAAGEDVVTYALATPRGPFVPVEGAGLATLVGHTVTLRTDATVPEQSAAENGSSGPLLVEVVDAGPAPALTEAAHPRRVHVAKIGNLGPLSMSDVQLAEMVAGASAYWVDESAGRVPAHDLPSGPGDAAQWVTYSTALTPDDGCRASENFWAFVNEARALFPGVSFQGAGADQLVIVKPEQVCTPPAGAVGVGSLGSGFAWGGVSLVLAREGAEGTLIHEWGHNYGLGHSGLDTSSDPDLPSFVEYGNIYNVMGYGIPQRTRRMALSSAYREILGIDTAGEIEHIELTDPGRASVLTRILRPRSDDDGLRGLRLVLPDSGTTVFVDYRAGTGQDAGSAYALGSTMLGWDFTPGLVVEKATNGMGKESVLVPGGAWRDPATGVGETWSEGAITIDVASMTPAAAEVVISYDPGQMPTSPPPASLTGEARVGAGFVASVSGWDPEPTAITYQWLRDGVPIDGATDSGFGLQPEDLGHLVSVRVTGHRPGWAPAVSTSGARRVEPGVMAFSYDPVVRGPALLEGSPLQAAWRGPPHPPVTAALQWFADGSPVAGAREATFIPTAAEVGKRLFVAVTLSSPGYTDVTAVSGTTAPIAAAARPPAPVTLDGATPRIVGVAVVGEDLIVEPGAWTLGARLSYTWLVGGERMPGTGHAFAPSAAHVGRTVSVRVTGRLGGQETTRTSATTAAVVPGELVRGTVTILGRPRVGKTLSAAASGWSAGATVAYRWLANGRPIARAATARLRLARSLRGKRISVRVTVSKPGYRTLTLTSARTPRVKR